MLDKIFSLIIADNPVNHMSHVLSAVVELMDNFEQDYFKDKNARDAAIDAVCELLQSHKANQNEK